MTPTPEAPSRNPQPPPNTRLILASDTLLDEWGTRTNDGHRITAEWGEPDENGWYTPTFTVDYTDDLRAEAAQRVVERISKDFGSGSICHPEQVEPLPRTQAASGGRP